MSDQTTQPAGADPCTAFEKDGVVDLGLMIDDAAALAGCAYTEAQKLTGIFGKTAASYIAQALVHLQRAHTIHNLAKNENTPQG